jgi:5-methylcytosine-specific restriction enzyme subunit McrC
MVSDSTQAYAELVHWTEYGIPIRNLWHMLLYAWNEVPLADRWLMEDTEDAPTLDALLASILMKLIQQRLRIGLGCSYVNEARSLQGIRGRLDFTESLKRRTFDRGQAYCEYQHYSANAPKNQIVRSTLARLVQVGQFGPDNAQADNLRHKLRWLTRILDGVDLIELKLDFIRRQQLGRNDGDYRLMLAICELILQRQMPTESAGYHGLPSIERDSLIVHRIYERFVANFYRVRLLGWTAAPQKRLGWHEKSPNQYLPAMVPDLILEEGLSGQIVLLDTKFTAHSLSENQWGKQLFDSAHLYQMYAYLKSQEHLSARHQAASGILLYPAVRQVLSERVELQGHALRIECVDLSAPWRDIEQHLLELILADGAHKETYPAN